MTDYCVNMHAQPNGDHEVHTLACEHLPAPHNRLYLGNFASCGPAVKEAKKTYPQSNGCYWCARPCNTG